MRNRWDAQQRGLVLTFILIFLGTGFFCSALLAGAAEPRNETMASFGTGKIKVRLYTDYFCVPCRAAEPRIEAALKGLVTKNLINVTFIDTPFHKFSSLYARYFLFVLNENRNFEHALSVRATLFEAAKEGVPDPQKKEALSEAERVEEYLKKRGIKFSTFDVKPIFLAFERYLREDNIDATPSCVIERNGKKEILKGGDDIAKALESLDESRLYGDTRKPSTPKTNK
jgi:hypothetical protein